MTTTSTPSTNTESGRLKACLVYVPAGMTIALVFVITTWAPRFALDVVSACEGANAVLVALIVALPVLDDSPALRLVQWWSARYEDVREARRNSPRLAAIGVGVSMGLFGHAVATHVQWVAGAEPKGDWWAWLAGAGVVALAVLLLEIKHSPTARQPRRGRRRLHGGMWKCLGLLSLLAVIGLLAWWPAWLSF